MKSRITARLVVEAPRFELHVLKTAMFSFEYVRFVDADLFELNIKSLQIPAVV